MTTWHRTVLNGPQSPPLELELGPLHAPVVSPQTSAQGQNANENMRVQTVSLRDYC